MCKSGYTGPMHSPMLNEHCKVHSCSDHNHELHETHDAMPATGAKTDNFVDPDSLAAMEYSQSPPINDQQEASPNLGNPELGIYEDIGVLMEPKIHELKIAQQFIESLKNATLDNSKLNDRVCEWLCNPPTSTVDDMLDPILRPSIDIYLAVGNASQETDNSIYNTLMCYNPTKPILSYDIVKQHITEISRVTPI